MFCTVSGATVKDSNQISSDIPCMGGSMCNTGFIILSYFKLPGILI